MLDNSGHPAADDLALLVVAVVSLSLFFSSLAASVVSQAAEEQGERLQSAARDLVAAVRDGPSWTVRAGVLLAAALDNLTADTLAPFAGGHPFRATIWDLSTNRMWVFESGTTRGDRQTAGASANVLDERVDPAHINATVWGP